MDINELALKYNAYVPSDNPFQRQARILQSIWRFKQDYPEGYYYTKGKKIFLGSRLVMPWARETLNNFLSDTIRKVVKQEVLDPLKSKHKLYAKPRIFNDLLSSQPLCFNLFGELQQDTQLATNVFKSLTAGRIAEVTKIEFEFSPGRSNPIYTNDRSAFDVYIKYRNADNGEGFIGIEVKYHENLKNEPAQHRSRYDEITNQMNCFKTIELPTLHDSPLQQIWRDHLLAGVHRIVDKYADGFFLFLYPQDNVICATAVSKYRNILSDKSTFEAWTLEEIVNAIKNFTNSLWITRFEDRYLRFDKIVKLL